jgi:hypothetical protein
MTVRDHPCTPNSAPSGGRRTDRSLGESVGPTADRSLGESFGPPAELAAADRLIADLAALVDAGLVVVKPHVLGPARYEAASEPG